MTDSKAPWPRVTIVITCYNQGAFLYDAVASAAKQDYPNLEIILINNGSTDQTRQQLSRLNQKFKLAHVLDLPVNIGICAAFNRGLKLSTGDYIIDLAADDVLLTNRVSADVAAFRNGPSDTVFVYSEAAYVDINGDLVKPFYKDKRGIQTPKPRSGYVFRQLFKELFICPPTVTFVTERLKAIGGYDEELYFEDFDAWMRLCRHGSVIFNPVLTTHKRIVPKSLGTQIYDRQSDRYLQSILLIGYKATTLAQDVDDMQAIGAFLRYYHRQAVFTAHFAVGIKLFELLTDIKQKTSTTELWHWFIKFKLNLGAPYQLATQLLKHSR